MPGADVSGLWASLPGGEVMATFKLYSEITISLSTEVEADSLEEATRIARDRGPQELYRDGQPSEEWCHSGEIDGEMRNISEG